MRTAIDGAAEHDRRAISEFPEAIAGHLPGLKRATRERDMEALLATLGQKRESHVGLFDEKTHLQLLAQGQRRLSFKATMAVVFVQSFGLGGFDAVDKDKKTALHLAAENGHTEVCLALLKD